MRNISYQILKRVCLDRSNKTNYQLHYQACLRHSKAEVKSLQPLKVTHLSKRDPSKASRNHDPSSTFPSRIQLRQDMQYLDEDTADSLDQLADTVGKYTSKVDALRAEDEATRHLIKENRFIRAKTIQKKYFKKLPPPSLLTWSAKEQIRFLHQQDPDTWSVKELAENFPVSISSIKKILKSNPQLYRGEDILRHDDDVKKHWLRLKTWMEEDTEDPTFDTTVIKDLKNSQNDNLVANATGIKHLPFPVKREKSFTPTGPFSSIVSDCYDTKEQEIKKEEEQTALNKQLNHISEILSEVSDMLQDTVNDQKHDHLVTRPTDPVKHDFNRQSLPQSLGRKSHVKSQGKEGSKIYAPTEDQTNSGDFVPNKYRDSPLSRSASIQTQQHFPKNAEPKQLNLGHLASRSKKYKTFISGDCVYDQNGEFLYRIP